MVQSKFDDAYFARLRKEEEPFWGKIRAIPTDSYRTEEAAGIAALRRIWHRSRYDGVEWGGVLYRRDKFFGVGTPQKGIAIAVVIQPQYRPANTSVAGAYHTHVDAELALAIPERLSPHDVEMAKQYKVPIYMANPAGEIIEVRMDRHGTKIKTIGKADPAPVAEYEKDSVPPPEHMKHRAWRMTQMPGAPAQ